MTSKEETIRGLQRLLSSTQFAEQWREDAVRNAVEFITASPSIPPAGEDPAIRDFRTTEPAESDEVVKDYLTTEFDNQDSTPAESHYIMDAAMKQGKGMTWHAPTQAMIDDGWIPLYRLVKGAPKAPMTDDYLLDLWDDCMDGINNYFTSAQILKFARAIRGEKS